MLAANTLLPVIGVPIKTRTLNGVDSLLSIVQMPGGVPVGTMAIGDAGAVNAALYAASILALQSPELSQRLAAFRQAQRNGLKKVRPHLMIDVVTSPATIGIIGGGQLGRMLTQSAKTMGYRVGILEPTPNSPAGQVADFQITAPYDDQAALTKLAKESDVLTYEFENVDLAALEAVRELTRILKEQLFLQQPAIASRKKHSCRRMVYRLPPLWQSIGLRR